jgi:hypothetical protein
VQVVIRVDLHDPSATIEVVDDRGKLLGPGRFPTDRAGYASVRSCEDVARSNPAIEDAGGTGRPLAQRLLEAGEQVIDVPATLAARVQERSYRSSMTGDVTSR